MGKRRMYDDDVEECFDRTIAIFFEAIRYRQQLVPNKFFAYPTDDITKKTSLSYKQQLRARRWLTGLGDCSWLEVKKVRAKNGGIALQYKVTEFAKDAIKKTVRRRNIGQEYRRLTKQLSV